MESKDIILAPLGVEDPEIYTVGINDTKFNIAMRMQMVTLIGNSIVSVSSEYREFNISNQRFDKLISNKAEHKQIQSFYSTATKAVNEFSKQSETIEIGGDKLTGFTNRGLVYCMIYYLLLKRFRYSEEQFVNLNQFEVILPITRVFDKVFHSKKIKLSQNELINFAEYILGFQDLGHRVGSKLLCLSRNHVLDTSNLSYPIWKFIYINKIIRNISIDVRESYLSPLLDWAFVKCPVRSMFTNANLVSQILYGENIHYIKTSAHRQYEIVKSMVKSTSNTSELNEMELTTLKLKEISSEIDYVNSDLAIIIYHANRGIPIYVAFSSMIDDLKHSNSSDSLVYDVFQNFQSFKQVIFQYLYGVMLLAKQGVIHNDPHLNNILISRRDKPKRLEYMFPSGELIDLGMSNVAITLIDYDKAILSYKHHNKFDTVVGVINQNMGVVFESVKENVVDDYDQVFNCYVMYDVIKYALVMTRVIQDFEDHNPSNSYDLSKHKELLQTITKMATDVLSEIYNPSPKFSFNVKNSYGSIEWLIISLFKSSMKVSKTKSSAERNIVHLTKLQSSFSGELPNFISSKRKYADLLKQNFISKYASESEKLFQIGF